MRFPRGELKFTNYVWNIGNTTDRFNLTLTNSTFPAGSQIELYRADGVTPLLDSNADGIPDTGLLAANTNLPVVVKVRFPSSYTVTTNTVLKLHHKHSLWVMVVKPARLRIRAL